MNAAKSMAASNRRQSESSTDTEQRVAQILSEAQRAIHQQAAALHTASLALFEFVIVLHTLAGFHFKEMRNFSAGSSSL